MGCRPQSLLTVELEAQQQQQPEKVLKNEICNKPLAGLASEIRQWQCGAASQSTKK